MATKGAGTGERTGAIIAGMMGVIAETTGAFNYRDHGQRRRYGDDATDDAWFFLRYSLSVFGYMYTSRRGHGSKKKVTCIILVTGPFFGKASWRPFDNNRMFYCTILP